jgi:hypothetical protein
MLVRMDNRQLFLPSRPYSGSERDDVGWQVHLYYLTGIVISFFFKFQEAELASNS